MAAPLTTNEVTGLFTAGTGGGSPLPQGELDTAGKATVVQLVVTGSRAILSWNAFPGQIYRIQYRDSLAAGEWQDLPGDVTATSAFASKEDSLDGVAQRFYRIVTP